MRGKPTKSSEISERLRQDILDGKFDDARKLPSEHQLMRSTGVGIAVTEAGLLWKRESTERKKK